MIKKFLSLFLMLWFFSSYAQNSFHSVMIIPFEPNMYFSDADEQLAQYNKKTVREIRTLFRYGLNINLNARIMTQYETVTLLNDTTPGALNDLNMIYKSIVYFQDDVPQPESSITTKESTGKKTIFKKSQEDQAQKNAKYQTTSMPKKYMNVHIVNKELLPYLAEKYQVDVFLFCNQFNLQTNYEHCLDRATNTYERDLWIHYSIFDKEGKQLAGGISQSHFPSNSNDILHIMKTSFPQMSEQIASRLPGSPPLRLIKEN